MAREVAKRAAVPRGRRARGGAPCTGHHAYIHTYIHTYIAGWRVGIRRLQLTTTSGSSARTWRTYGKQSSKFLYIQSSKFLYIHTYIHTYIHVNLDECITFKVGQLSGWREAENSTDQVASARASAAPVLQYHGHSTAPSR